MRMAEPPTGTVTFLFTDIEGSTKLWERSPEGMRLALARHDEILRQAVDEHGGHVFKTVGDAFCAAFTTAPEALEAALSAQRSILVEEWVAEIGELRVRMALHTGAAEERRGDYFGSPLNRVARLLSAAHGGQVLLSLATQALVRDDLPEGAELRDLGERRLKDLFRAERIFQVTAPDLPSSFPPLKTLDVRPNNLPASPTLLIGREQEVTEVCGWLQRKGVRLLTLTGTGGTGKTRLGLQAAAELLDEFRDGVFFVTLAPIIDPKLFVSTVARVLGVRESGDQPLEEALKTHLRDKQLLLLLDNFEQVLEAAPVVGELLSACPKLKVLVTSRSVLRVYGEHEYVVPPLALPDPGRPPPIETLTQYEAVSLFIERAQAAKPGFRVTNENAPAVAEICHRLDGLPLAIELAAARLKLLSPQAMLARLSERLKLLRTGPRDLPERHRSLRGAIEWSHDLLDEDERALFARLSVFSGGRTLEAIEAVCNLEGELDVLEGVQSLLEKSLLMQEEGPEGEPRFVMLETIHEYAREKLEDGREAEEIRRAHAEYFLNLAEEAEQQLKGRRQLEYLEQLEAEHDNFRAALAWALERGDTELAMRLGGALWWFWLVRGHLSEGQRWLEQALAKAGRATTASARAKALTGAGRLLLEQGNCEAATALLEESVSSFRAMGHKEGLANSVDNLGIAQAYQGELEQAKALFEESLELFREAGDNWGVAECLNNLALLAALWHERDRETALHEESLKISRELGDKRGITMSLVNLSSAALSRGDHQRAAVLCEEGLALGRELGDKGLIGLVLNNLGLALLESGDSNRAMELLEESLTTQQTLGDKYNLHGVLLSFASASAAGGKPMRAARLVGAAQGIREATGIHLLDIEHHALVERFLGAVRSQLEAEVWEEAWEKGRAMTLEEAVSYALEEGASG